MEFKKLMTAAAIIGAMSFGATSASAFPTYLTEVNTALNTSFTSCALCHATAAGGTDKGITGLAATWKSLAVNGTLSAAAAASLAAADSDGDGISNAAEVAAGTDFYTGVPASSGGSTSSGGCVTASATTPLMMVLAMLTLGFFARRKKS